MDRLVAAYIMARGLPGAEAVREVICCGESIRAAARRHGVPASTLKRRVDKIRGELKSFVRLAGPRRSLW